MLPVLLLCALLSALSVTAATANGSIVKTGLAVLLASNGAQLSGKKVLILTNPTAVTPSLDLGVDVLVSSKSINIVGVMGPEHGFRGTAQAGSSEGTFVDSKTGLTVYDAYNANTTTLIKYIVESGCDTVVFDIQDVGARFYTYTWAMHDTMVAAAITNVSYVVLDRPNPITGLEAFGPVLNTSYASYVGRQPIAQAHGMTSGELAKMFVGEGWIRKVTNGTDVKLEVVEMQGWKRDMTWKDTGLPWVMPSPNMPTVDTALTYPGACMFEGTNVSEGRGTTRPFELLGATFANETWRDSMSVLSIPYTKYRFACFAPTDSKFEGETACGLQTYINLDSVAEYKAFDPVYLGLTLLSTVKSLYTNGTNATAGFQWRYDTGNVIPYDIDRLTGSDLVRTSLDQGLSPDAIKEAWTSGLEDFKKLRAKYLLY